MVLIVINFPFNVTKKEHSLIAMENLVAYNVGKSFNFKV
jgi:hypothetical protein